MTHDGPAGPLLREQTEAHRARVGMGRVRHVRAGTFGWRPDRAPGGGAA